MAKRQQSLRVTGLQAELTEGLGTLVGDANSLAVGVVLEHGMHKRRSVTVL